MDRKERIKALIIEKSRDVFLEKGIVNTVMNDIALSVDLSVRTIYRYFPTKEDIAYEIIIELINEWNNYQKLVFDELKGSGLRRLELFLNSLILNMSKKPEVMRYISEFDFYFNDRVVVTISLDHQKRFNDIILKSDYLIESIIELGKKDGSIKQGTDTQLMVATISNVLWSFGQRIAIRGEIIKKESGFDGIELIKHQVEIYIKHIKEV
ncbi:MAG: TetR/AcrR family transcriptional regulator [Erysipelothrix sp.]|nr:TetR/AcrR family transcriptional regulator [Erysipelothrix sp.]